MVKKITSARTELSARQLQCSKLLLSGKTASQIGLKLGLSKRTVEYYLDNVKAKLNCGNKVELILKIHQLLHLQNESNMRCAKTED
jgi:DNA-binding CsgD family transcriptional regulator